MIRYPKSTIDEYLRKIRHLESEVSDLKNVIAEIEREKRCVANHLIVKHGLSPNEGKIMAALVLAKGKPVGPDNLYAMSRPRGDATDVGNTITVQISRLRKKIPDGWIETVYGSGWRATREAVEDADV